MPEAAEVPILINEVIRSAGGARLSDGRSRGTKVDGQP